MHRLAIVRSSVEYVDFKGIWGLSLIIKSKPHFATLAAWPLTSPNSITCRA